MAYQRFSLRPLKLTHRAPGRPTDVKDIHRGVVDEESSFTPKDCKATLHLSFCVYRSVVSMNFTPIGNIGTLFPYTSWECWNPFPNVLAMLEPYSNTLMGNIGTLSQYIYWQYWNPISMPHGPLLSSIPIYLLAMLDT